MGQDQSRIATRRQRTQSTNDEKMMQHKRKRRATHVISPAASDPSTFEEACRRLGVSFSNDDSIIQNEQHFCEVFFLY